MNPLDWVGDIWAWAWDYGAIGAFIAAGLVTLAIVAVALLVLKVVFVALRGVWRPVRAGWRDVMQDK